MLIASHIAAAPSAAAVWSIRPDFGCFGTCTRDQGVELGSVMSTDERWNCYELSKPE